MSEEKLSKALNVDYDPSVDIVVPSKKDITNIRKERRDNILNNDLNIISYIKQMLFRNRDGSMIILDKYEFKNDELYYSKIKNIKFGKNDLLNLSPKNSVNYSNSLIDRSCRSWKNSKIQSKE